MNPVRDRAVHACQRCRRQKLKCDTGKPCLLCRRAGIDCVPFESVRWKKTIHGDRSPKEGHARRNRRNVPTSRGTTGAQQFTARSADQPKVTDNAFSDGAEKVISDQICTDTPRNARVDNSSSAMSLMEEAFRYHDSTSPQHLSMSAFPASQPHRKNDTEPLSRSSNVGQRRSYGTSTSRQGTAGSRLSRSAVAEMTAIMPPLEPSALLVDTYFDRIHWFMLLFHQDDFRAAFEKMFDRVDGSLHIDDLGFLSTVVAVCAISLHYLDDHRKGLLAQFNIDVDTLKEHMFGLLGSRLLQIMALQSLEAVQVCVLLGTYYLYHGEPDLAWPICGCGLRIAQALDLHRHHEINLSASRRDLDVWVRANEARKRCWWAIYEIETFCSMLYGLPPSISDGDCDVELLQSHSSASTSDPSLMTGLEGSATLLSYKPTMSKLSTIVKTALTDLYKICSNSANSRNSKLCPSPQLNDIIHKVKALDNSVDTWRDELLPQLRLDMYVNADAEETLDDEVVRNIGAHGPGFEAYIFRLQALALELAYHNARILIHRPLLSYKMVTPVSLHYNGDSTLTTIDPCRRSLEACRDAALRISEVGSLTMFRQACSTYAAAFVSTTLFTAGITLCILSSMEPLSQNSHDAKLGIRRLMQMQTYLKSRSIMADQGLQILKRLTTLTLERELSGMFDFSQTPIDFASQNYGGQPSRYSITNCPSISAAPSNGTSDTAENLPQQDHVGPPRCSVGLPSQQDQQRNKTPVQTDEGDVEGYQFYEDPTIARNLLDFRSEVQSTGPETAAGMSLPLNAYEQIGESRFIDQEQSWIWGFDFMQDNTL